LSKVFQVFQTRCQKNTIDSCINSATDRRGHSAYLHRRPNRYPNSNRNLTVTLTQRASPNPTLTQVRKWPSLPESVQSTCWRPVTHAQYR